MSTQVMIFANGHVDTFRGENNTGCSIKNLLGRALPQMEQ